MIKVQLHLVHRVKSYLITCFKRRNSVEEEKLNSTSDLNIVKHSSVITIIHSILISKKNNNNDASFNKILSDGYKFSTILDNSLNDLLKVVDGSAVNLIIDSRRYES